MGYDILVTGGAGFIGSTLCDKLLELGYEVINIDNFNDDYNPMLKRENIEFALNHPNYKLYEGDIRDLDLLEKVFKENNIKYVVHLAAMAGVRKSLLNPLEYVDIDIKGTVALLEYARKYNIKRFLFGSSSSVYGINKKIPFSENDSVNLQVSPYATAKRAGELYCATYNHLYKMSIGCLRFFTVYGPRQRPEMAISKFVRLIEHGEKVPMFGDGTSQRDYTYVDDIVDGIIAALNADFDFEIFNLGNSETISLLNLIQVIENVVGKKALIEQLPFQKGDVPITYADTSKAKKILGYNPKIDIEEGIKRYYRWCKKLMLNY